MEPKKQTEILIVEDEESIRVTFEMFLTREGYGPITTAATFQEALDALGKNDFQLIISDIVLEDSSGLDLLKYIREKGIECPVVMITGYPNLESASEAVRHGAFDYVSKPVNKETLLRFVSNALKHWKLKSEKIRLQKENERYRRYLEVIFSSVGDAIITVDNKKKIVQMNPTARQWFDVKEDDDAVNLSDLHGKLGRSFVDDTEAVLVSGKVVNEHQVEISDSDEGKRVFSLKASPINDEKGEFTGVVITARDVSPPEISTHGKRDRFHGFIGSSPAMQGVYQLIETVGRVDTAVLITGESGTGKELAAEALHAESPRRNKPLIKVDCAAIPEDLLESELFGHRKGSFTGADHDRPGRLLHADKGTLFLDEIGDISPRMQLRLLRFLQEKTFTPVGQDRQISVDVRVIAATNVILIDKVKRGDFREDLYYRLKVVEIQLPPLRDRDGAVVVLSYHFLNILQDKLSKRIHTISDQAMQAMIRYSWPGNVRELQHVMERAVILCNGPTLFLEHLPEEIRNFSLQSTVDFSKGSKLSSISQNNHSNNFLDERQEILLALKRSYGKKAKAARLLGIDRSTLYRKIHRLGIEADVEKLSHTKQ